MFHNSFIHILNVSDLSNEIRLNNIISSDKILLSELKLTRFQHKTHSESYTISCKFWVDADAVWFRCYDIVLCFQLLPVLKT